jgi:glucose/arabinose dehydrogenase
MIGRKSLFALLCSVLLLATAASPASHARSQANFPRLDPDLVPVDLTRPVYVTHANDGSGRLFIVEQAGQVLIMENDQLLPEPFLDISDRVLSPASGGGSEEGLLSIAFPPGDGPKSHFYAYYTMQAGDGRTQGDNRLSRFAISADPNRADPASEEPLITFPHPTYANHNGGQLAFGPDGYLYIGTGDGGGSGDPNENAQNTASLLGKLLRIDVGSTSAPPAAPASPAAFLPVLHSANGQPGDAAYAIPNDNPFVGQAGARGEIWALGLRNPWRFSFDRLTGDLYIGDVGQGMREEIDFQPADSTGGENYGWDILEGTRCYEPSSGCTPPPDYSPPVAEYSHNAPENPCSVTGGYVYRGPTYPELQGIYLYADYCSGQIWGLRQTNGDWETAEMADTNQRITSFGEDEAGEVYLVAVGGNIYRVRPAQE